MRSQRRQPRQRSTTPYPA